MYIIKIQFFVFSLDVKFIFSENAQILCVFAVF